MKKAFTLIELLVVVLIIGILSAIALPQYKKVVWKSRTVQLMTAVSTLAQAQEVYYLANGKYPESFADLDVSFDNLTSQTSSYYLGVASSNAIRSNEWMQLAINRDKDGSFIFSTAIFTSGPYIRSGVSFCHKASALTEKTYYCQETGAQPSGYFCPKVMQTGLDNTGVYGYRYFAR